MATAAQRRDSSWSSIGSCFVATGPSSTLPIDLIFSGKWPPFPSESVLAGRGHTRCAVLGDSVVLSAPADISAELQGTAAAATTAGCRRRSCSTGIEAPSNVCIDPPLRRIADAAVLGSYMLSAQRAGSGARPVGTLSPSAESLAGVRTAGVASTAITYSSIASLSPSSPCGMEVAAADGAQVQFEQVLAVEVEARVRAELTERHEQPMVSQAEATVEYADSTCSGTPAQIEAVNEKPVPVPIPAPVPVSDAATSMRVNSMKGAEYDLSPSHDELGNVTKCRDRDSSPNEDSNSSRAES